MPNVVYAANASAPATRPYVPGAVPTFTVDFSTGQPVFQPGTFDDSRPEALASPAGPELGGIFSDIGHFTDNVIKGGEQVAKMAWQFTENAVQTVIHTAENIYNLVITDVEDAVTAVVGFLKTVVADIIKVIQWLSALFNWENILHNHAYIKQSITNPGDPANPGILDRLAAWVASELNGGTDTATILAQLSGQSCAAVGSTAQATAGQTVQTQQAGNNDPNQVYNTGGGNNANQCTWMHEKVTENSSSASIGGGPAAGVGASWDPGTISAAFEQFLTALGNALTGSFADLPEQIQQKIASTQDNFKDPKSALSTGLSDMIAVFQVLADDMAEFAQAVAKDFLQLLDTLLGQIVGWLDEPVDIPFVSALYHALTGDQLSILDLTCLLAAVPGTILLDVITGSPTVPDTVSSGPDASAGRMGWHRQAAPQGRSCSASRASSSASSARHWTFSCWASLDMGRERPFAKPQGRLPQRAGLRRSTSSAGRWKWRRATAGRPGKRRTGLLGGPEHPAGVQLRLPVPR